MIAAPMPVSDPELSTLARSHDIIALGMLADDARRARHGTRTTFVRVRHVDATPGAADRRRSRRGRGPHRRRARDAGGRF